MQVHNKVQKCLGMMHGDARHCWAIQVVSGEVDWTDQMTNTPSLLFLEGPEEAYMTHLPTAIVAGMNRLVIQARVR